MIAKFIKSLIKWILRAILLVLALIAAILVALYIPAVQDWALGKALDTVNADPSRHLTVERFRLYPPVHIEADGVTMVQDGDTMAHVGNLDLRVKLWPLLAGRVGVENIDVADVRFNLGNPDSAMYMRGDIGSFALADATVRLGAKDVAIGTLDLDRTSLSLDLRADSTERADTTATATLPWKIAVHRFNIDSLVYRMTMPPTIDTLTASIPRAAINGTVVDLSAQRVDVERFAVDSLAARYLTLPAVAAATNTVVPDTTVASTTTSMPWTVNVCHIDISAREALYATSGVKPVPGLDMDYIQVSDVSIVIDSLMNRGTELRVPIRRIAAHERCGLDVTLTGLFAMDSDSLSASHIHLGTLYSSLDVDAMMGMQGGGLPMPVRLLAGGYLSPRDVSLAMPSVSPMLSALPPHSLLDVDVDITGRDGIYNVDRLSLDMPRCFDINASGSVAGAPDINTLDGTLRLSGHIANGRWIKPTLTAARLDKTVNVPPLNLAGKLTFSRGTAHGDITAATDHGRIALNAGWKARAEAYDLTLRATDFPVDAFMPGLGVERVSASVDVNGHGYDPFKATTAIDARVLVNDIVYNKRRYTDLDLTATLRDGRADLAAVSGNRLAAFDLRAGGNLSSTPYDWTLSAEIDNLDLRAMGLTDSVMDGKVSLDGHATVTPGTPGSIAAAVNVTDLDWHLGSSTLATTDIAIRLNTDSTTTARIGNHDLNLTLASPASLDSIMAYLPRLTAAIDTVTASHHIDVDMLQQSLPSFTLDLTAGQNNIVSNYLRTRDMGFTALSLAASNDSLIDLRGKLMNINSGTTVIDTATVRLWQDGNALDYRLHIGNRPGTLDQWARVTAVGRIADNWGSILLDQQDISGKTGYRLGFIARWMPDAINVRVVPSHPVIGYKTWTVNDSNFVSVNTLKRHIDADLVMNNSESSIHLYTEHDEHNDSTQEDMILNIKDIKLAEWVALNPFAPPVSGDLSANMRFGWDDRNINGSGLVSLTDLFYNRQRVGSFDLGLDLMTNKSGTVRAAATLMVDSIKTITAEGNLNDSTARNPFLLDFKMIHFPLNVLNPFLPKDMARLSGTLNGTMDITGSLAEPVFNGFLYFDSTTLAIPMLGASFKFSDRKIPMDSNIVTFDNFTITGANANPLSIAGTVDARHISDILIDLSARARDMQIINSGKKRSSQVYGKAYIDLDATVRGSLSRMDVDATLSVLENTNVTYIVASATDNLASKAGAGDMVKFVNFADTTLVATVDSVAPSSTMMSVNAILNIRQGSVIGVDLSTDGKNRVQLLSQGSLNYNMDYMGDSRLTGRLNLNGGFVRYTPPFMSEKLFDFQEGSYISFNGNMMNPYLNIKAIDVLRANVQQEGQNSRLINFDVILTVTNSLDNMNVAFNLATDDDITVANELQSMSPEQRANQAMNLLLYNVYTGPGTRASSSLNGNPLFSFLESQVNSWAANNIKGVDLSFGIDQYDRTVNGASSTTTQYSYKVSKSLFNDRFKISVGGNYASDADADENLSQNLINDISFEYYITPSGSMYVKIFRHTGYESILEGEVTQTGVGFVYKRKIRNLLDMFRPFYRRRPASTDTSKL